MIVFYTMIDIAALNSMVLWLFKNPSWNLKKQRTRRRLFLHDLGMALVKPLVESRNTIGLRTDVNKAISTILNHPAAAQSELSSTPVATQVAKCALCIAQSRGANYKKGKYNANKVKQRYHICGKHCKKHSEHILAEI